MSYRVYKIQNLVNGKIYIGLTSQPIQQRWLHHQLDAYSETKSNNPFYQDLLTEGANSFSIEIIEDELSKSNAEIVEQRWINNLRTTTNGYNISKGGPGKRLLNPLEAQELYEQGKNLREIADILQVGSDTVSDNLRKLGYTKEEMKLRQNRDKAKKVAKINKDTDEIIEIYYSVREAARQLGNENLNGHISACCREERKTASGYKWKFIE